MNDWVILASLILVASLVIAIAFAYFREEPHQKESEDDHDDILGI